MNEVNTVSIDIQFFIQLMRQGISAHLFNRLKEQEQKHPNALLADILNSRYECDGKVYSDFYLKCITYHDENGKPYLVPISQCNISSNADSANQANDA